MTTPPIPPTYVIRLAPSAPRLTIAICLEPREAPQVKYYPIVSTQTTTVRRLSLITPTRGQNHARSENTNR